MLFQYSIVSIANAIVWIIFSPVSDKVTGYYNFESNLWVNMLSMVFLIAYVPFLPLSLWVLDHKGLRSGVLVGAILTGIGAAIRATGKWSFWGVMIGQMFGAIGQPFFLNAMSLLAVNWFPDNQRTIATTIASVANPVGVAIGFVIGPMMAPTSADIPRLLYLNAIIINALLLPIVFLFRGKPSLPPSASASVPREENFLLGLKKLVMDKNFWILCIVFGFALGAYNTLATVINEMMEKFGYDNMQSGILGALVIVFGIVGSGIAGVLIDKTHWYKAGILLCLVGSIGAGLMLTLSFYPNNFVLIAVGGALLGLTITPVIPIGLELSCEISFPLGEAIPNGLLLCSGQITGIGLIFLMSWLIDSGRPAYPNYITLACFGVSLLASLAFTGKLKRLEHEKNHPISSIQDSKGIK